MTEALPAAHAPATSDPAWMRYRSSMLVVAVGLTVLALVVVATLPTGSDRAADVAPDGARVAAAVAIDADTQVLLLSEGGRLRLQIAYRGPKGWLGLLLAPAPDGALAAWAGTDGEAQVAALSAVYGRTPGDTVEVTWADGVVVTAEPESDGAYVVARAGVVASDQVRVLDGEGSEIASVEGP